MHHTYLTIMIHGSVMAKFSHEAIVELVISSQYVTVIEVNQPSIYIARHQVCIFRYITAYR